MITMSERKGLYSLYIYQSLQSLSTPVKDATPNIALDWSFYNPFSQNIILKSLGCPEKNYYFGTLSAIFPSLARYVLVNQIGQAYSFAVIYALILYQQR